MKPAVSNALIGGLSVALVLSVAGNFLAHQRYSSSRPLVTIGDEVIPKGDYEAALELQAGGPVIKKLVYSKLVLQAAAKAGLTPTDADVQARLDQTAKRSPQMAAMLKDPNRSDTLKKDMKADLALENLRIKGVSASEAEAQLFYQTHPALFAVPPKIQILGVVAKPADVKTAQDLLRQGVSEDVIARQPSLHVLGVNGYNLLLSRDLQKTIVTMKTGEIRTFPAPGGQTLIVKMANNSPVQVAPYAQVKDLALRYAKLTKAPTAQQEIAKLYHDNRPRFDNERYAVYFQDIEADAAAPPSKNP